MPAGNIFGAGLRIQLVASTHTKPHNMTLLNALLVRCVRSDQLTSIRCMNTDLTRTSSNTESMLAKVFTDVCDVSLVMVPFGDNNRLRPGGKRRARPNP